MKSEVNQAIEDLMGIDLRKIIVDEIGFLQSSNFTAKDVLSKVREEFNGAGENPFILNLMIEQLLMTQIKSEIVNLKDIDFDDYTAMQTMIVGVSRGVFIGLAYADIEAVKNKKAEQVKNIEAAQTKYTKFCEMIDPVIENMYVNGIATVGESISDLGLDAA